MINLTMTAWSKVLRREFLAGFGVRFPAGIHEDIPVTCAALPSTARTSTSSTFAGHDTPATSVRYSPAAGRSSCRA